MPTLRISLLSRDPALHQTMAIRLQSKGYQLISLAEPASVLGLMYSDPPDMILIDLTGPDPQFHGVLRELRRDSYFSVIPVIGLISEPASDEIDWEQCRLDDYVLVPVKYNHLFTRIRLSLQRIQRIFDNNPLTKLPGNTSIQRAIAEALGKPRAVCHIDINHFKPYNDTFGFGRGDEVLRMVARIMANTVHEFPGEGFAGHIGGDDFVFIVPSEHAAQACATMIAHFNTIASDLFGDEDKARGFYLAQDRSGASMKIPLLGISIAVVPTENPHIQHAGKVAEVAAELKETAKQTGGSCYVVDLRQD